MNIDYCSDGSENISKDILDEILKNDKYFDINEKMVLKEVESPFIIPDNEYDLNEMNNYILQINAKEIKSVSFKGGNYYKIYERDNRSLDSYIVYGNEEEGFNIFKLI